LPTSYTGDLRFDDDGQQACRRECVEKKSQGCRGINFTELETLLVMGSTYDTEEDAGATTMFSELQNEADPKLYLDLQKAVDVCDDPQIENHIATQIEIMKKVEVESVGFQKPEVYSKAHNF
jgi:hypothetical protein